MLRSFAFGLFLFLCSAITATAADFVQFPSDAYYQKPIYGGPIAGVPVPSQVDFGNSFIPLTQYVPLANGAGTVEFGGYANTAALIAGSPAFASLQKRIDSALSQIQQQAAQIQQTQRGLAATAAMANIWMPSAPGKTAWAINGASFMGNYGGGISLAHRLNFSVPVAITASYGNGGSGNSNVVRVGLMGEF